MSKYTPLTGDITREIFPLTVYIPSTTYDSGEPYNESTTYRDLNLTNLQGESNIYTATIQDGIDITITKMGDDWVYSMVGKPTEKYQLFRASTGGRRRKTRRHKRKQSKQSKQRKQNKQSQRK